MTTLPSSRVSPTGVRAPAGVGSRAGTAGDRAARTAAQAREIEAERNRYRARGWALAGTGAVLLWTAILAGLAGVLELL